uniref:7TM diverse intracellular signaling domain-containing protein n=1 Tax=Mucilaginibacter sp. Bleaf8 TaxID=2834430 RepID=UPI001BCF25BD|nr:7TM diverse intracellular signaling domain-containing protein [Mucilaginibacter sp. Bleaf8]
MHFYLKKQLLLCGIFLFCWVAPVLAQKAITITGDMPEHICTRTEIDYLEDASGKLSAHEATSANYTDAYKPNPDYFPKNFHRQSVYWFRIKVNYTEPLAPNQSLFEFFDQTTQHIEAYIPDTKGTYQKAKTGAGESFTNRLFQHKNFEFVIPERNRGEHTYYFRVSSTERVNIIIVYRTISHFIHYALVEYITYGLFYGMVLIFCLHNLLMFLAVKLKQYLYYVLYILSVGLYEMCTDGIAFQFLWPQAPHWNAYAYGIALYCVSLFALVFTKTLLQVKQRNKLLYQIINYTIAARTLYFLVCLFANNSLFTFRSIELLPLSVAFVTGIIIWKQGFKPARFFVLAYFFLFIGFVIKGFYVMGYARLLPGAVGHYSISFGFVLEMIWLSFSIGDQVRIFRKDKDLAQQETIRQMDLNAQLQNSINQKLELQVAERTKELVKKSAEIEHQARVIECQNIDLINTNKQLQKQAEEISRMNVLLEKDNFQLKTSIEKVTEARIDARELTFEEFSQKYPDREHCNEFLAGLKWANGYKCSKCGNANYSTGRAPYSRRCTKCSYEESVMCNTIFENNRIPINKAFYIVYLIYTTKGNISSYQLAEKLDIRQSTCWAYAIRVKGIMDDRKILSKRSKKSGWSDLILKG